MLDVESMGSEGLNKTSEPNAVPVLNFKIHHMSNFPTKSRSVS